MSDKIEEINKSLDEMQIEQGLKQKPNSIGTVYGVCLTKLCPNHRKVGYYTGGFCKKCSTRRPEDKKEYVLKNLGKKGILLISPNPDIDWITKVKVRDLSDKLDEEERKIFYGPPEEFERGLEQLHRRKELKERNRRGEDDE